MRRNCPRNQVGICGIHFLIYPELFIAHLKGNDVILICNRKKKTGFIVLMTFYMYLIDFNSLLLMCGSKNICGSPCFINSRSTTAIGQCKMTISYRFCCLAAGAGLPDGSSSIVEVVLEYYFLFFGSVSLILAAGRNQ